MENSSIKSLTNMIKQCQGEDAKYALVGLGYDSSELHTPVVVRPQVAYAPDDENGFRIEEFDVAFAPLNRQIDEFRVFADRVEKGLYGWQLSDDPIKETTTNLQQLKQFMESDNIPASSKDYPFRIVFVPSLGDVMVFSRSFTIKTSEDQGEYRYMTITQSSHETYDEGEPWDYTHTLNFLFKTNTSSYNTLFTDLLKGTLDVKNTNKLLDLFVSPGKMTSFSIVSATFVSNNGGVFSTLTPVNDNIVLTGTDVGYMLSGSDSLMTIQSSAIKNSTMRKVNSNAYEIIVAVSYGTLTIGLAS